MNASLPENPGDDGMPRIGALIVSPRSSAPSGRRMQRDRAVELAANDGRPPQEVSKADWEQAKRDVGSPDTATPFDASGPNPT
jgi:hypothetical protein